MVITALLIIEKQKIKNKKTPQKLPNGAEWLSKPWYVHPLYRSEEVYKDHAVMWDDDRVCLLSENKNCICRMVHTFVCLFSKSIFIEALTVPGCPTLRRSGPDSQRLSAPGVRVSMDVTVLDPGAGEGLSDVESVAS